MAAMGKRSASVPVLLFLTWLSFAFGIGLVTEIGNQEGDISPQDGHRITLGESIHRSAGRSMQTALLGAPFVFIGFFAGCAWMETRRREDDEEWGR